MKKVFAFVAMMGLLTFGVNQTINAQEEAPAVEEVAQEDSAAVDSIAAVEDVEAETEAEEGRSLSFLRWFVSRMSRLLEDERYHTRCVRVFKT